MHEERTQISRSDLRRPSLAYSRTQKSYLWGPTEVDVGQTTEGEDRRVAWSSEPAFADNAYYLDVVFWGAGHDLADFLGPLELAPPELSTVGAEFLFGEGDGPDTNDEFLDPSSVRWSVVRAVEQGTLTGLPVSSFVALAVLAGELGLTPARSARGRRRQFEVLRLRDLIDRLAARNLTLTLAKTRANVAGGHETDAGAYPLNNDGEIVVALGAAATESLASVGMLKVRAGLDARYLRRVERSPTAVRAVDLFARLFMTDRRLAVSPRGPETALPADPWALLRALHSTIEQPDVGTSE